MDTPAHTMHLQVTSGRGPAQCQWVVSQVVDELCREAPELGLCAEVVAFLPGKHEDTLRSAVVEIRGDTGSVSGFVDSWVGTIQWVGKDQFRDYRRRKNWFVGVHPCQLATAPAIELRAEDLVVETMRGSGPGGQNVNRRETAVRVRHLPSGVMAFARDGRTQLKNLKSAKRRLGELLAEQQQRATEAEQQGRWGQHDRVTRGRPIRVYTGTAFRRR